MTPPSRTLEAEIGELLGEQGLTLAVAESCTGGLLGHRITEVPGSSNYFLGGIISYSNEAKENLLGVQHQTLLRHGAVSEETAREMAQGARRALGSDLALAVTGIAGPGGGTIEKPVGLAYIALAHAGGEIVERHVWPDGRSQNKIHSAEAALTLLRSYLNHRTAP
ncbi:MAG: CinA family protein [Chloroflexi bacterium]|nr:CinA family protein [Chloroflexota bacterium]